MCTSPITTTPIPTTTDDPFCDYFADGSYEKVFSHNKNGGVFSSHDEALNMNPGNPCAALYSVLDQLESYRGSDGSFHLKLCYPEKTGDGGSHCNEWIQSSNPATDTSISGFSAVSLAFTQGGSANFAGLGRSPAGQAALINDDPSGSTWYSAIGATQLYNNGIPGPAWDVVDWIQLYVCSSCTGNAIFIQSM